jgi:hypothetical protein
MFSVITNWNHVLPTFKDIQTMQKASESGFEISMEAAGEDVAPYY